jgi:NAD-reducing hydrogenase large subunit
MLAWSRGALAIARDFTTEHLVELIPFGSFDSNHLSIVREGDGALDLYDGVLRAVDKDGADRRRRRLPAVPRGGERGGPPWSYMKFPFIKRLGPEHGWYRVGPLARLNTCSLHPHARGRGRAARSSWRSPRARPNNITMCYHWARMIELLHAIEVIRDLLHDPDLQGDDLLASGPRREETVGVLEAPRGTLFHHYRVGRDDRSRCATSSCRRPTTTSR